jgi:subtilase family serine protease
MRSLLSRRARQLAMASMGTAMAFMPGLAAPTTQAITLQPLVAEYQFLSAGTTPPTEAQCFSVGRRCFTPASMQASYNLGPLYTRGLTGAGQTIVIVDSFGSDSIRNDLHVFDTAFGLPAMCGEADVVCAAGMPIFDTHALQGSPATKAPPPTSKNPGLEARNAWALEVSLDVEWAHSIAPGANIQLVTTPTAETLGVQGFPDMMNAEQYVVDHRLGSVISQSFGSAEQAFGSSQSLLNLRHAFVAAQDAGITVIASSGDNGTANPMKQPVANPRTIPFPTVGWPASDPLVTGVGGTYLCTNPTTGTSVDSTDPPAQCRANPGVREVGWIASGGGFSAVFARPSFQNSLPAGSTPIGSMRGVPDVAYQASAATGVLVYITAPGYTGIACGSTTCSAGWYVVGGTSSGTPQFAGIVAIADQLNGSPLGYLNPGLYRIGADPARYANDFYDVTTGNNQLDASIAGYPATTGWDPVTGLGTPNSANLVPDLVAAVHGH